MPAFVVDDSSVVTLRADLAAAATAGDLEKAERLVALWRSRAEDCRQQLSTPPALSGADRESRVSAAHRELLDLASEPGSPGRLSNDEYRSGTPGHAFRAKRQSAAAGRRRPLSPLSDREPQPEPRAWSAPTFEAPLPLPLPVAGRRRPPSC
eukprot:TRINITY_DN6519_c5_g1_i1.p2 TRINITY_DN6519_c5_g1~~TRINITY_DN6519_c5_g1_i1.p2  ORF type:complete len:177 (+),score=49.75 TRINITY_DN6519_c5_g1_i1:76-531(+)